MSRQLFQRYLLLFLSVNAILTCGLSRRIPRSCPSCNQDCPEALTVRVPWYSYQESNLQPRVQDLSVDPLKNSLYSRFAPKEISEDMIHDDILSNQDFMPFGNYRSLPRQKSVNEDLFFRNLPNAFSESLNGREIFSQNEPMSEYPFAHVYPHLIRQSFDRSTENLFFRSPRDKYSESPSKNQNFQDYKKNTEDLASKSIISYHANRDTKPWQDSTDIFPDNILSPELYAKIENSFPSRREDILEEKNSMKTIPDSVERQYKSASPQEAYFPEEVDVPRIKHQNILPQNLIHKATEEKFFNNLDKNLLQSWNLEQLKQTEDNLLETYPAGDEQTIISEDDNEEIDHNSHSGLIFPRNLDIWEPTTDRKFIDNLDFVSRNSPQESAEIKRLRIAENNQPQVYPPEKDIIFFSEEDQDQEYSDEEDINQKYFKDEIDKDPIRTERDNYNSHNSSQNMDIWGTTQDKEFFDYLNVMLKNLRESQKAKPLEIYSQDNKYFQDKENKDVLFEHKVHADTDQMIRAPVNSYDSFLSRYLDIFNNAKHSDQSSKSQESTIYSTLHKDPIEERNARFFDNKAVIHNVQKVTLPKDISDAEKYSDNIPAIDTRQNTKDDIWNNALRELDPASDLFNDIEIPPTEPTESTLRESRIES